MPTGVRVVDRIADQADFAGSLTDGHYLGYVSGTGKFTLSAITVPTAANPTGSVGLTAVNGSAATFLRSDGAPALDVGIAPTWTGRHVFDVNGAASAPPVSVTGDWFTGGSSTTTKPQVLIEPTGTTSTGWSTSGTGIGVNAPSGFAGNLFDGQVAGVSKLAIGPTGQVLVPDGSNATPAILRASSPANRTGFYFPVANFRINFVCNTGDSAFMDPTYGLRIQVGGANGGVGADSNGYFSLCSGGVVAWSSNASNSAQTKDTGLARAAAGVMRVTNGTTGIGATLTASLVEANTAGSGSPNILTATESRTVLTNEGTTAQNYHTLPTAAAGYVFEFVVQDTDGIRVVANTGDTIRDVATVSASAGYIQSTTVGSTLRLLAINATEWIVMSKQGTWTVDS